MQKLLDSTSFSVRSGGSHAKVVTYMSLVARTKVWGDDSGFSPFVNHTWWEQQAFAQQLLGDNHRHLAEMRYKASMSKGATLSLGPYEDFLAVDAVSALPLGVSQGDIPSAYPAEVRVVPQFEMPLRGTSKTCHPAVLRTCAKRWILLKSQRNSYHPISSRLVGETWAPGAGLVMLLSNGTQHEARMYESNRPAGKHAPVRQVRAVI